MLTKAKEMIAEHRPALDRFDKNFSAGVIRHEDIKQFIVALESLDKLALDSGPETKSHINRLRTTYARSLLKSIANCALEGNASIFVLLCFWNLKDEVEELVRIDSRLMDNLPQLFRDFLFDD